MGVKELLLDSSLDKEKISDKEKEYQIIKRFL